jgi:hypothetical protein
MAKYDKHYDSYFLLENPYKQKITNTITDDEKWKSCKDACEDCRICKIVNPFRQQCWRPCDRCRYCKFRNFESSKTHDLPYYNKHPYLPDPAFVDYTAPTMVTSRMCGPVAYARYINQYNNYIRCKECQAVGTCWSKYRGKCVECSDEQLAVPCERKFGCPNSSGNLFPYGPPKNPIYTDCKLCWKN